MPKTKKRYVVTGGSHNETLRDEDGNFKGLKTYEVGDVVESEEDLITLHPNKFRLEEDVIEEREKAEAELEEERKTSLKELKQSKKELEEERKQSLKKKK